MHQIVDPDDQKYYLDVITALDSEFLSWARNKQDQDRKSKEVNSKRIENRRLK